MSATGNVADITSAVVEGIEVGTVVCSRVIGRADIGNKRQRAAGSFDERASSCIGSMATDTKEYSVSHL